MSLPTLDITSYFLTLPSTGKSVKYRPFLVKEEKILSIALMTGETPVITNAVKEIIQNCTFKALDVDKLTTFDIEWLFLQIRIKAKGNQMKLGYHCQQDVTNPETSEVTKCMCQTNLTVNLDTVKIHTPEGHTKKIMLTDSIGVIMKYPTVESLFTAEKVLDSDDPTKIYEAAADYIEVAFDGASVYENFTKAELIGWIDELNDDQFSKIENFFYTLPTLRHAFTMKCPKCKFEEEIALEGLSSFLD